MSTLTKEEVRSLVLRELPRGNYDESRTAGQIASRLKLPEEEIHEALLELRRKRLARDHRKQGERVWREWYA